MPSPFGLNSAGEARTATEGGVLSTVTSSVATPVPVEPVAVARSVAPPAYPGVCHVAVHPSIPSVSLPIGGHLAPPSADHANVTQVGPAAAWAATPNHPPNAAPARRHGI